MKEFLEQFDPVIMRGIVPFDSSLFIDTAEDFVDTLSHFTAAVEYQITADDGTKKLRTRPSLPLTEPDIRGLVNPVQRLRAFLLDGQVNFIGCRAVLRGYLEAFWREASPIFAAIAIAVPSKPFDGFLDVDHLRRLQSLCDIIRELDGIRSASQEERLSNQSLDSWIIAQKNGVKSKSDYLATLLSEPVILGISPREYERQVIQFGRFPLAEYYNERAAEEEDAAKVSENNDQPAVPDFAVYIEKSRVTIGRDNFQVEIGAAHYLHVLNQNRGQVMSDPDVERRSEFLASLNLTGRRPSYLGIRTSIVQPEIAAWIEKVEHKGHRLRPPIA